MPFGRCNAPKTFQRSIKMLLEDCPAARLFVDDILIASLTMEQHLSDIRQVLENLFKAVAKINYEKSQFGKDKINYLGMVVDEECYCPNTEKNQKFAECEPPRTPKQLQTFLGFLNSFVSLHQK